ncbi:unnamed protein product, partial [Closterium sp. NIES-54]
SEGLGFESQCVHFGHPSAGGCQRSTGDPQLILGKGYRLVVLGGYGRTDPLLNKPFYPNAPYPTRRAALPCPACRAALLAARCPALPCPSRRLACCAPPCPARRAALLAARRPSLPTRCPPDHRVVLPSPRAALLAAASPCPTRTPPCWPPHRRALPARRPAGRRPVIIYTL